jgi:translation initiation factor 4E
MPEQQYFSLNEQVAGGYAVPCATQESAEELQKKELPLRYTWILWEQMMQQDNKGGAQYSDATKKVKSFSTVQEFWQVWNHLPQPSELLNHNRLVREDSDGVHVVDALMIFREGVKPEWEDKMNAHGGHFQFQLKNNLPAGQIDEYWNNLVLGVIGASIDPAHLITGLRLVDKLYAMRGTPALRIEVWFTNDDQAQVQTLRRNVENCMMTKADGSVGAPLPKCEVKSHSGNK